MKRLLSLAALLIFTLTANAQTNPPAESVLDRFLRYVKIDTQSQDGSDTYPSTAKQLDLLRLLADELKQIGLDDAELDQHGYVTATLPPRRQARHQPPLPDRDPKGGDALALCPPRLN